MERNQSHNEQISKLEERIQILEQVINDLRIQNSNLAEENKIKDSLIEFCIAKTAKEITNRPGRSYVKFKSATVLFANINTIDNDENKKLTPETIDEIDRFFFYFNNVIKQYKLMKIRSVGDIFICVGGVLQRNLINPVQVAMAALEMKQKLIDLQKKYYRKNRPAWTMSFGIHTGPVYATFTGNSRMPYLISGSTVNMAGRIEKLRNNEILLSEDTYEVIKDFFDAEVIGQIPIKYRGDLKIYSLKSYKPHLSLNKRGKLPNNMFWINLQLIHYETLSEEVLGMLEKELPAYLFYHNLKHTIDVTIGVEILAIAERLDKEDILLLKTAALFHDSGQIYGYQDHEKRSCSIARTYMKKYNYSVEQVEQVERLIMATKYDYQPQDIKEQIIKDADLDYLGRPDFIRLSNDLYKELKAQNLVESKKQWIEKQIEFLSNHTFYTKTAQKRRQVNKEIQIQKLKEELNKIKE